MRVITANVNGIRAAVRRGGLRWLAGQDADVLLLQEVRATDEHLHAALAEAGLGDWSVAHTEGNARGRAGVAVVTRARQRSVRVAWGGLDAGEFGESGRWVEADVDTGRGSVSLASVYVPTGEAGTARQAEKERFLDALTARFAAARMAGAHLIVGGDLNVAHTDADLKNWKGNRGKAGCLPAERAVLDSWRDQHEIVDVHRRLAGPGPGPYTWWTWRGKAFDTDTGWRIDYQLATKAVAEGARSAVVGRAASYAERWSDHAPVTVDYAL